MNKRLINITKKYNRAARGSINRLKKYPRIYKYLNQRQLERQKVSTLKEFTWSSFGEGLLTDIKDLAMLKQISDDERAATLLEIQRLEVLNKAKQYEAQIADREAMQAMIGSKTNMAKDSIIGSIKDSPMLIAAALGLTAFLFWPKRKRR